MKTWSQNSFQSRYDSKKTKGAPFSFAGFATAAAAQTSNATLQGIVADTSGAVLPGVTVKLESPSTGLSRDLVTNAAGVYVFNFLPSGTYTVSAELSGFKTARHEQVRLEIGQNLELDLRMEVGNLSEVVNVEGTAAPSIARPRPSAPSFKPAN